MKKIFIREAGILLEDGSNNFLRKVSKAIELCEIFNIGLEITIKPDTIDSLLNSSDLIKKLSNMKILLLHLHTRYSDKLKDDKFTMNFLDKVNDLKSQVRNVKGTCIHPDLVEDFSVLKYFGSQNDYIAIENLDKAKSFGNRFEEIRDILERFNFLTFVLDTAHIQEMVPSGEPDIEFYIEEFEDRLVEFHLSQTGNYYHSLTDTSFSTDHSLLSINKSNIQEKISSLSLEKNINYVIEGVLPFGNERQFLLEEEIKLVNLL